MRSFKVARAMHWDRSVKRMKGEKKRKKVKWTKTAQTGQMSECEDIWKIENESEWRGPEGSQIRDVDKVLEEVRESKRLVQKKTENTETGEECQTNYSREIFLKVKKIARFFEENTVPELTGEPPVERDQSTDFTEISKKVADLYWTIEFKIREEEHVKSINAVHHNIDWNEILEELIEIEGMMIHMKKRLEGIIVEDQCRNGFENITDEQDHHNEQKKAIFIKWLEIMCLISAKKEIEGNEKSEGKEEEDNDSDSYNDRDEELKKLKWTKMKEIIRKKRDGAESCDNAIEDQILEKMEEIEKFMKELDRFKEDTHDKAKKLKRKGNKLVEELHEKLKDMKGSELEKRRKIIQKLLKVGFIEVFDKVAEIKEKVTGASQFTDGNGEWSVISENVNIIAKMILKESEEELNSKTGVEFHISAWDDIYTKAEEIMKLLQAAAKIEEDAASKMLMATEKIVKNEVMGKSFNEEEDSFIVDSLHDIKEVTGLLLCNRVTFKKNCILL